MTLVEITPVDPFDCHLIQRSMQSIHRIPNNLKENACNCVMITVPVDALAPLTAGTSIGEAMPEFESSVCSYMKLHKFSSWLLPLSVQGFNHENCKAFRNGVDNSWKQQVVKLKKTETKIKWPKFPKDIFKRLTSMNMFESLSKYHWTCWWHQLTKSQYLFMQWLVT